MAASFLCCRDFFDQPAAAHEIHWDHEQNIGRNRATVKGLHVDE
jgi:uncharacterized protein involved in cysteine biosynthesis